MSTKLEHAGTGTGSRILAWIPKILLGLILLYSIFPFVWTFLTSLKLDSDIVTANLQYIPQNPSFENYSTIWERSEFPRLLWNSAVVTALTVTMCITIGSMAGYAISRHRFRGRVPLMLFYLSIRMVPLVLLLIPLFIILRNLGLLDTRFGLALAYTTFSLPIAIWFLKNFFDAIPFELEDAARVDGASRVGTLLRVVVPLSLPGIGATALLVGIGAWNEFLFALLMTTSTGSRTWPVGLQLMVGEFQLPFGQLAAGAMLTITPIIVGYLFFGRTLVKGLLSGGIKG